MRAHFCCHLSHEAFIQIVEVSIQRRVEQPLQLRYCWQLSAQFLQILLVFRCWESPSGEGAGLGQMIIPSAARFPVVIAVIPQQTELFTQKQPDGFRHVSYRFREKPKVQQRFQQDGDAVAVVVAAVSKSEIELVWSQPEPSASPSWRYGDLKRGYSPSMQPPLSGGGKTEYHLKGGLVTRFWERLLGLIATSLPLARELVTDTVLHTRNQAGNGHINKDLQEVSTGRAKSDKRKW
jgi:hypothetical protein